MDAACQDRTKGDPQKYNGPPQSSLHGAEDGTKTRNIQKLYKKQLPLRHDYIVHAVVDPYCRRFPVIRGKGVVDDLSIYEIAADQQCKTQKKT